MAVKTSKYAIYSIVWPAILWVVIFFLDSFMLDYLIQKRGIEDAMSYALLTIVLSVMAGFIGTVYSILALIEIKKSSSLIKGKFLAIIGISLWWIVLAIDFILDMK